MSCLLGLVVLDFLSQSVAYLDSLDWIEKYSWFGFFVRLASFALV